MGKPMAKNLLKGGYEVWVNNRSRAPMDELVACGAHAGTRREVAENCEVIITMLPNGPQVKEVMLGSEGAAQYMHAVQEILQWLNNNGLGDKDPSSLAKYYEHLAGIKIGR